MSFKSLCSLGRFASLAPRLCRSLVNRADARLPPAPRESVQTPADFLKAIGRGADAKLSFDEWNALWACGGQALKKAGVGVQDRRYILWCMEKFRQGEELKEFVHEARPKKKVRGRGPAVQNGRRIRSRRLR